ncbi:lipid-A-disaccharide synthase N-terminal domain-containing protein [Seleniivibrio woodruffii]|uniref:Lipid-A-disaccharide synthase-like uncharacterized protein n=1 Tax=Seleniivibrio woodruffii TaxID=1078050 RepID=A0A4R1K8P6_9BACT|nr:lipid-A-disaccharide synthase N-terminal domain-containing protein [Seleniivibrio woodruffii]TCK60367.1 lipid-A-disaccharide synthase-like uncharacterized protein [Seleniivibrio woodruffii]TVZ35994.1 lipid-A-disaccharide synthase-like uncharacterized protein [Seleniivibrio woodruffii]
MSVLNTALIVFGFAGQVLFFMRFILQWLYAEKYKKSAVPMSFWYFSLAGGFMLLTYAILVKDPVFILGQSTGAIIYMRNISLLMKERGTRPRSFGFWMVIILLIYFGMVAAAAYFFPETARKDKVHYTGFIFAVGMVAQGMFFLRFLVQWLVSEKAKKSVFPVMFWWFSLAGSVLLLIYSVMVHDAVFIAGQSVGILIYVRNLYFIKLEKQSPTA